MESVVLVIHLILALGIIALVLLQRSEGGGLGIGGGGGGGLTTAQGAANAMTRTTAIFAGCFFVTSLILGILAGKQTGTASILDNLDESVPAVTVTIDEGEETGASEVPIPAEPPSVPISD